LAKAQFHKHQKVWVESVGCWAAIERLNPVWTPGFEEPVRITYDVGLGRDFVAHELRAEAAVVTAPDDNFDGAWRLMRARNKWQAPEDCPHHPHPGTCPVVVTDKADWGGWRTPGAEYDRNPYRIEAQARLVASAPKLLEVAKSLAAFIEDSPHDAPAEIQRLARLAAQILRYIAESPAPPEKQDALRAAE
jgi:hypothetical protein